MCVDVGCAAAREARRRASMIMVRVWGCTAERRESAGAMSRVTSSWCCSCGTGTGVGDLEVDTPESRQPSERGGGVGARWGIGPEVEELEDISAARRAGYLLPKSEVTFSLACQRGSTFNAAE